LDGEILCCKNMTSLSLNQRGRAEKFPDFVNATPQIKINYILAKSPQKTGVLSACAAWLGAWSL
jgi:hypothetical protein